MCCPSTQNLFHQLHSAPPHPSPAIVRALAQLLSRGQGPAIWPVLRLPLHLWDTADGMECPGRPLQTPCLQLILANLYTSPTQNRPLRPELWGRPPPAPAFSLQGPHGNKGSPHRAGGLHQGQAGLETGVDQGSISFPHPMTKDSHVGKGSA